MKDKLVRDNIPELLYKIGCRPFNIREVEDNDEMEFYLWEKFYEETKEFIQNPCVEELVDIIEVSLAILKNSNGNEIRPDELTLELIKKRLSKGAFNKGYIMEIPNAES